MVSSFFTIPVTSCVLGSHIFINAVESFGFDTVSESHTSLIVSILSAGAFSVPHDIGRKSTVILGCFIYLVGCTIQMITGAIVAGRLIAGLGVGFESSVVILYMSGIVDSLASPAVRLSYPSQPVTSKPQAY